MLISTKHKFAFVHVPKAGGTAIRTSLLKFCDDNRYWHQGYNPSSDTVQDLAHINLLEAHADYDDERVQECLHVIMCVRDPIERFLSAFDEHRRQQNRPELELNRFILEELSLSNISNDWRYIHFRPQSDFLLSPLDFFGGKDEDFEYDGLDELTEDSNFPPATLHVMEHNRLAEDFADTMKIILPEGTDPALYALPTHRVRPDSSGKPTRDLLSPEAIQRLFFLYFSDYEAFDFEYPAPALLLPDDHWARIETIHRKILRDELLENNSTNVLMLTEGQRKAYDKVLTGSSISEY